MGTYGEGNWADILGDPEYSQRLDQSAFAHGCEAAFVRMGAADQADEHAVFTARQVFHRRRAQPCGQHAVADAGCTAALHMAELAHAHVEAQARLVRLEVLGQRIGIVRRAFGHQTEF